MKVHEHVPLSSLSQMRVGGHARFLVEIEKKEELPRALHFANERGLPVAVIGGGSNTLPSDDDCDLVLIKITEETIACSSHGAGTLLVASAGYGWDALVEQSIFHGARGLENLSAIPGTVGAAPIQNIGAYGVEVGEHIEWVEVFDIRNFSFRILSHDECQFSYRNSVFKQEKHLIVTSVAFLLKKDAQPNITYQDLKFWFCEQHHMNPSAKEVRDAVIAIRAKKFPDLVRVGTLGSFFQNPILDQDIAVSFATQFPEAPLHVMEDGRSKTSAAWLIDRVANYRGVRVGDVGTWPMQALVLVNYGKATEYEISHFATVIVERVRERTGITLVREVLPLVPIK